MIKYYYYHCGVCKKEFKSQKKNRRFCSHKCFYKVNNTLIGTHRMTGTRFYKIWQKIKERCLKNYCKYYKYYGGRGITICDEWQKFENFKKDMYVSYLKHCDKFGIKETTIDRVDNNGNYNKENCRWATYGEQALNRRFDNMVGKSGYYGLYLQNNGLWIVRISDKGKLIKIGLFKNLQEAINAYNKAAKKLHGKFAKLN